MNFSQRELKLEILELQIKWLDRNICVYTTSEILLGSIQSNIYSDRVKEAKDELVEALKNRNVSESSYINGLALVNMISNIEYYFSELLKLILKRYPKKIKSIQYTLSDIVEKSKDEIVSDAAERYIYEIMYKKPKEYLSSLCSILSIDEKELNEIWPSYVEAKARRDLGIHNDWIVNDTYLRKANEVGIDVSVKLGDDVNPEDDYMETVVKTLNNIITKIDSLVVEKYCKANESE